jgi:hypothetical protein
LAEAMSDWTAEPFDEGGEPVLSDGSRFYLDGPFGSAAINFVAACNALPALLDRLDKAEGARDALRAALLPERIAAALHDLHECHSGRSGVTECGMLGGHLNQEFRRDLGPDQATAWHGRQAAALLAALTSTDKETRG